MMMHLASCILENQKMSQIHRIWVYISSSATKLKVIHVPLRFVPKYVFKTNKKKQIILLGVLYTLFKYDRKWYIKIRSVLFEFQFHLLKILNISNEREKNGAKDKWIPDENVINDTDLPFLNCVWSTWVCLQMCFPIFFLFLIPFTSIQGINYWKILIFSLTC